jgi:hypothetical protein
MPQTHKVLAQVAPTASASLTTLYTAPASTSAVVSTMAIANTLAAATTYRIAVRPAGTATQVQHYLAWDSSVAANDTILLTAGLTLGATDVISVSTGATGVAFHMYGVEIT